MITKPIADATLRARADAARASYLMVLSERSGGGWQDADGVLLWHGSDPCPWIVNGALRRSGSPAGAATVLRTARDHFGAMGHGFGITTRAEHDDDIAALLAAEGFEVAIDLPVMVLTEPIDPVPTPPAIVLAPAAGPADHEALRDVVAEAFGPELSGAVASAFGHPYAVLAPDIVSVVAWEGDRAVGGGLAHVSGATAEIVWVSSREAVRGRGVGTAVTAAVCAAARDRGADVMVLESAPLAEPLYARLGFREVGRNREQVAR